MPQTGLTRLLPALLAVVLLTGSAAAAQTRQRTSGDDLFQLVASLDAKLFQAYNTCDVEAFASFFVQDVEFYHDRGGVTHGRQALVDSLKRNICGKTRRDLVPGSLEVHPMDGYGALQTGAHRFCEPGAAPCAATSGGIAKFIHLWQHRDGAWKITRVISYDHVSAGETPTR